MLEKNERQVLMRVLAEARRRIFFTTTCAWAARAGLLILPIAVLAVAADRRWNESLATPSILGVALFAIFGFAIFKGLRGLGARVRSALALDEGARLKDRVSSAWEFLNEGELDEARRVQVHDAIRHAEALKFSDVVKMRWPRFAVGLPVLALLLAASFLIPPVTRVNALVSADPVKDAQLKELAALREELQQNQNVPQELQEVLKKLEEVRKQFEKGEISERDMMLELGRLDENLRSKVAELGVENLESEMNAMVPHLSASAATAEAARAMKEKQLDKAAEEIQKLAQQVKENKLSKEEKKKLAAQLGTAAAKLGKKKSSSTFSGDLAQASESLEKSDNDGFESACKGMCDKLGLLKKCQGMKSACNKIGLCKASLGQCNSKQFGYTLAPKVLSKNKGGLKAGTAASGDPFGDANRLADSYKKLMQVAGQAGQGPTETETEITEGQMSKSQLSVKEIHANYAAAAEEVIEKEDIPLSHRYHVKRYFQAIRPQE